MANELSLGGNRSGDTVRKRPRGHKRDHTANFSFHERQQLRNPGQANNDLAIFQAREEVARRYPSIYASSDDVTAAVLDNTISPDHLELLVDLRKQYLSQL